MQWLILLGYGVDNTHSYYDCLDSHGKDSSSPQSICDDLPNYIPKQKGKMPMCTGVMSDFHVYSLNIDLRASGV